jgi:hypothetical protein
MTVVNFPRDERVLLARKLIELAREQENLMLRLEQLAPEAKIVRTSPTGLEIEEPGGSHCALCCTIEVPTVHVDSYVTNPSGYLARRLGVSEACLRGWLEYRAQGGDFPCSAKKKDGTDCRNCAEGAYSLQDWAAKPNPHLCRYHAKQQVRQTS